MELTVAVSPEFEVTGEQVAHAWNRDEASTKVAVARVVPPADHYNASELLGHAVIVLGSLTAGVTANGIYDLLKRVLKGNAKGRQMYFKKIEKSDGTTITEMRLSDDGTADRG
ncbi:hypothetical protein [Amycolatopsis sp. TNS106]|uniref:hypothetical protein n=1 Tax=Amycolatopsis sp. TNS106 TaxID=2861750 RepID=UPI001C599492|nr:hypothetical protein [Amycolatopsis sp. TNS106]QXV57353.1 hypothetical protein CVV72_10235 [Amycolatopsis sp. TNS106]